MLALNTSTVFAISVVSFSTILVTFGTIVGLRLAYLTKPDDELDCFWQILAMLRVPCQRSSTGKRWNWK